jgi:hypothetical protein
MGNLDVVSEYGRPLDGCRARCDTALTMGSSPMSLTEKC